MKYCTYCGNEMVDEAVICVKCGQPAEKHKSGDSGLKTAAKILMVISTVFMGFAIIPLIWCIPMTVSYFNKVKNGEPVSLVFNVFVLLFVNTIAGILMLCDNE